jgi:hypothetical protein
MTKYTPAKSYEKWSNGYYSGYSGNSKYGSSSFWMDDDILKSYDKGETIDSVKLMSYQRAIGNFVRILTKNNDIKVHFHTKHTSLTDGKTVTISSKIDSGDFDTMVGLALHEASHCILTDFKALPNYLNSSNIPASKWQFFKGLVNIIEDRRIDYYVMKNAPGYYGYYNSLYDTYFRSKEIDKALSNDIWCDETEQHYENHICNFANPNRNLNALKYLRKIWNVINLAKIDRLKSTSDVIVEAREVYDIIQYAVEQANKVNDPNSNNKSQPQDNTTKLTDEELDQLVKDIENGDVDVNEDNVNEEQGESNGEVDTNGLQGEDEDDENGSSMNADSPIGGNATPKTSMTPAQSARLQKALKKQKEFTSGDHDKKSMKDTEAKKINEMLDQDINVAEIDMPGIGKIEVVIAKGMTDAMCNADVVGDLYSNASWGRARYEKPVEEGWSLGTLLGKKLKTREEERTLKTTRLPSGRIDKRLIAELGFGNDKVFSQTLISTTKQSTMHISLDASGSMGGEPWAAAIKTAVAVARAASMIGSLRVVIDVRGSARSNSRTNRALVWVVYDSQKDSISIIRNKFKNLFPGGSTPEGLCYDAIMKEIVGVAKGKDSYFINVSDGEPGFSGYHGSSACAHTAKQIKKMRDNGINVMSYFVGNGSIDRIEKSSSYRAFITMYGKDARAIDLNNLSELSKSLNSLFERNITHD